MTIGGGGANQRFGLMGWIDGDVQLFIVKCGKKKELSTTWRRLSVKHRSTSHNRKSLNAFDNDQTRKTTGIDSMNMTTKRKGQI